MKCVTSRIPALLLSAALLTGCAEQSTMPQETETQPHTTETAMPETSSAPELTFSVRTDGVEFLLNGEFLQTIPTARMPDAEDITVCDYDSDGFPDAFLPESPHSLRGHYYRYDDAAGQLVLWDALNFEEGGTGWYMERNSDGTLQMHEDSIYGSCRTVFRWKQDTLLPQELEDCYWRHGCTVNDTYQYADGEKILIRREIRETEGSRTETIEFPLYFRMTEDAVQVMKNTEILQELPLGSFWESYAALGAYFAQQKESPSVPMEGAYLREPEQYLGTEDYDFDGHWDLYIPDTLQGECTGTYYRFSSETGRFALWDAMNAVGAKVYTDPENCTLTAYHSGTSHSWQWQDGALLMIETDHTY